MRSAECGIRNESRKSRARVRSLMGCAGVIPHSALRTPHSRVGRLEGRRPRHAGSNARLGPHGIAVRVPIARLTAEDGSTGFGASRATRDEAAALLGARLDEVFSAERGAMRAG